MVLLVIMYGGLDFSFGTSWCFTLWILFMYLSSFLLHLSFLSVTCNFSRLISSLCYVWFYRQVGGYMVLSPAGSVCSSDGKFSTP